MSETEQKMDSNIIKLRGLPWNVTAKEIITFLDGVEIVDGENGVHLITSPRDGRPNGEAFVECNSEGDYTKAFEYHEKMLGHRYIEVLSPKMDEFESIMRKQCVVQDTYVKLRGLPYSITNQEIENFFDGLELKKEQDGIHIVQDNRGRATGEAFVQFVNLDDTEKALKRNREKIGHRYIEIFRSSASEFKRNVFGNNSRPSPYDRNDRGPMRATNGGAMRGRMRGSDRRVDEGPWKTNRSAFENFYEDDTFNGNGGGNFGGFGGGGGGNSNNNIPNNGMNNGNGLGNGNFRTNDFSNNFPNRNSFGVVGLGGNLGNNGNGNLFGNGIGGMPNLGNAGGGGLSNMGGGISLSGGHSGYRTGICNDFDSSLGGNNGGGGGSGGGNFNSNGNNNNNDWNGNGGGNNGGGGGGGMNESYCVHLRGMPYYCDEQDIYKFFAPLKPINCQVIYNNRGLHSGEADALFPNQAEAMQAMSKHKSKMGSRYIELFYNSSVSQNRRRF